MRLRWRDIDIWTKKAHGLRPASKAKEIHTYAYADVKATEPDKFVYQDA